jgi:hypothetical protein
MYLLILLAYHFVYPTYQDAMEIRKSSESFGKVQKQFK